MTSRMGIEFRVAMGRVPGKVRGVKRAFVLGAGLGTRLKSLTEFPPAQKAATFDFSELMKQLMSGKQ